VPSIVAAISIFLEEIILSPGSVRARVIYFKNRKISFSAKMLSFSGINHSMKRTHYKNAGAERSISKKKILFPGENVFIFWE